VHGPAPGIARGGDTRVWSGGLVTDPVPGEARTRVAVRLALRPGSVPPGAVPLLVELLGTGAHGRLIHRLRGERPLAYGVAAMSWTATGPGEPAPSVGGYALVDPQHAAEAAEVLLTTVREAVRQGPSAELSAAALRCRTLLLVQLDQPFAAVEEERTRSRGGTTAGVLAEAAARCARDGLDLRLDEAAPAALAITGVVLPDQLSRLESLS